MDTEQLAKTVKWLDEERQKDRQDMAALQERLKGLAAENGDLKRKLQMLQTDLTESKAQLARLAKVDELMDGYRRELTKQLEDAALRRAKENEDLERVRKVERGALNKTLAELKKGADLAAKLDREAAARRDEEERLTRIGNDLQKKTGDLNKFMEDRNRQVAALEEGRKQDAKRISELQAELTDLRKRLDESRNRVDQAEDSNRRIETRLGELLLAENERRTAQNQWTDAQALAQADRDRGWQEIRDKADGALQQLAASSERMTQYAETHREMRRLADDFHKTIELMERRITESGEIQRLAEERSRQEWATFLADDQKRWTTHMLLRDEQWREHDRQYQKELDRLDALEEQVKEVVEIAHRLQEADAGRLQALSAIIRDALADYEQKLTKVR